jgi:hypothetical protein
MFLTCAKWKNESQMGSKDDNWSAKLKHKKRKTKLKIPSLNSSSFTTLEVKPTFPTNETCSSHVQNESNNGSQVGSKDDNWSAKLKHKKRKTKLKIPSLDSSSFTTLEAKPFPSCKMKAMMKVKFKAWWQL